MPDSMVRGVCVGTGAFARPSSEASVPDRKFFDLKILLASDCASRVCLSFSANSMITIG
jgi:hypothetical protein